jgi:flagellar biogenesis protein FliO
MSVPFGQTIGQTIGQLGNFTSAAGDVQTAAESVTQVSKKVESLVPLTRVVLLLLVIVLVLSAVWLVFKIQQHMGNKPATSEFATTRITEAQP